MDNRLHTSQVKCFRALGSGLKLFWACRAALEIGADIKTLPQHKLISYVGFVVSKSLVTRLTAVIAMTIEIRSISRRVLAPV